MAGTYKTEGIVLKRQNFSEADKIITVFSKHYGKIKCIAKGIRKLTSRKGGNLELFNQVVLFLVKGRNLDLVTEVQMINSFNSFRKDLKKVALAYNFCELVDRFTKEGQSHYSIYELLKQTLESLGQKDIDLVKIALDFKIGILANTGFGLPESLDEKALDQHIESIIEKKVKCFYE